MTPPSAPRTDMAPPLPPLPVMTSAVRAMWVRGSGGDIDSLVEFARWRRTLEVFVEYPAASDRDEAWAAEAARQLRVRRVYTTACAQATTWADEPELAAAWAAQAVAAGPFHRLLVELMAGGATSSEGAALDVLDAVVRGARGVPVDAVVDPAWALEPLGDGSVLDAVLARARRVVLRPNAGHADGPGGILEELGAAVRAAEAARVGFLVAVAAGAEADAEAIEREGATVRAAMSTSTGYRGLAVDSYRPWRAAFDTAGLLPGYVR